MSRDKIKLSEDQIMKIRTQIEALGYSQKKSAELIGISAPYLSEILSGAKEPTIRTYSDICRGLSISDESIAGQTKTTHIKENEELYQALSDPDIIAVVKMMATEDKHVRSDIRLGVQKEKLLQDLLRQKDSNEKAG